MPYRWLEATWVKVRKAGCIALVSVAIAVGVDADGSCIRLQPTQATGAPCKKTDAADALAMGDALCWRFMVIPGVGLVTPLSFSSASECHTPFRRLRDVAAYFGLTSKRWQSGTSIDVKGPISKASDSDVRRALYEAACGVRPATSQSGQQRHAAHRPQAPGSTPRAALG